MRKYIPIITAVSFLSIFIIILYLVVTKKIEQLDHSIYEKIAKFITPTNTRAIKIITFSGSAFGIILGILISWPFLKNNFDRGFLGIAMIGEVILNNLIKFLVKRPRPTINPLVIEKNFSFPSGHTMAITALLFLIGFFLWKSPLTIIWKLLLSFIGLFFIALVGYTRIYLGVHYFSDIIAGFCCSATYIMLLIFCYNNLKNYF